MYTTMPTYQDFEKKASEGDTEKAEFVRSCIETYKNSEEYKIALLADEYDHQKNVTIREYTRVLYMAGGEEVRDYTASNNKIASNFFNRLNTQRCLYSLGNGVSFIGSGESGTDTTKKRLGKSFDHEIKEAGYYALIHGKSYLFWDMDKLYTFKMTEYLPLFDEDTGAMRAGIRFWRLSESKPMNAVLYEEDGVTKYKEDENGFAQSGEKMAYKTTYATTPYDGSEMVIGEENYGELPIVVMYGSRLKQSTLVGMRGSIDAYDLVRSGFANDLADCAEIYWIVQNAGGMEDEDLMRFRDRLKLHHIANVDSTAGSGVVPYNQDIPFNARKEFLAEIRDGIYEDFGALDVHVVAAGATNDHIDAAYQPMDENAADFEHWVTQAIVRLLQIIGIDDEPVYSRDRISNKDKEIENVLSEAEYLDDETVLRKLPNIENEEIPLIMERRNAEDMSRMGISAQAEQ